MTQIADGETAISEGIAAVGRLVRGPRGPFRRRGVGLLKIALAILGGLAMSNAAFADEGDSKDRAWVDAIVLKDRYYVGEPIRVHLWITYEKAWFRDHSVSLHLRPMDLPVHVEAPWLRAWNGASPIDAGPGTYADRGGKVRIAVNDEVIEATAMGSPDPIDEVPGGGTRKRPATELLDVERVFVAVAPGDLVVPAPTLRFAYATTFEDDLINGRVPVDRKDVVVHGEPVTIHVLPLPDRDRPPEFQGAIGTFTVGSEVDRRSMAVGEHFHVTLRIEGKGNLATVTTPRLDGLDGFHVYGAIDDKNARFRTIVYDIAALRPDVRELPPIPFAYFDPEPPAAYRVVRTVAIPLDVRAPTDVAKALEPKPDSTSGWLNGAMVVLLALVVLGMSRRARLRAAVDPRRARASAAAATFGERVAHPTADVAAAFAEVLAAHLDCEAAAVIAPDLEARLLARRWSPALAARAAAMMDRLVHAGYGAAGAPTGVDDVRALVDELDEKARSTQSPR